jgi:hypothetical protein
MSAHQLLPTSSHYAEVVTGATIVVWALCPNCGIAAAVTVHLDAELRVSLETSDLHIKAKSKGAPHVCGQLPLQATTVTMEQTSLDDLPDQTLEADGMPL